MTVLSMLYKIKDLFSLMGQVDSKEVFVIGFLFQFSVFWNTLKTKTQGLLLLLFLAVENNLNIVLPSWTPMTMVTLNLTRSLTDTWLRWNHMFLNCLIRQVSIAWTQAQVMVVTHNSNHVAMLFLFYHYDFLLRNLTILPYTESHGSW